MCTELSAERRTIDMSVLTSKVCRTCGTVFTGGPRAWYCPECRNVRRKIKLIGYNAAIAAGTTRKLGSTDLCENCGKPYTVNSGRQKWCPDCKPEMHKKIDLELHHARAAKPAPVADPPESKQPPKNSKSLVGKIYGDIEAIEYIGNKRYKCRCIKCGDISEKYSTNLKGSLNCKVCGKGFKVDLTGKEYGMLTVEGYNKESKKWICRCECDRTIEVKSNNLKSGNTTTCGICGYKALAQRSIVEGTRVSQLNLGPRKNNKSGTTGVWHNKRKNKWCACIKFRGTTYWLGYHDYIQDAIDARKEAESKLHGEFLTWYESHKKEENND